MPKADYDMFLDAYEEICEGKTFKGGGKGKEGAGDKLEKSLLKQKGSSVRAEKADMKGYGKSFKPGRPIKESKYVSLVNATIAENIAKAPVVAPAPVKAIEEGGYPAPKSQTPLKDLVASTNKPLSIKSSPLSPEHEESLKKARESGELNTPPAE